VSAKGRRANAISSARGISLLAVCFILDAAYAAKPIDTDGPDFVESSEVVGKGRFQFEADVVSERDRRNSARVTTTSTPTLLRFGVTDAVELRVETEGWMRVTNDSTASGAGSTVNGTGDTALGVKWHAQDRDKSTNAPAVSWILHFEAPAGSSAFKERGIAPSLRSVITWELPHDLALGFMPGVKYGAAPDGHRFVSGIVGLVLNKQWTETFRTFVENSAPQIAHAADGGVVMSWDVGAAYLVTNDWQIGFRAGAAANKNTPDSIVLFELAGRF
jgi:hypothetical protein